MVSVIITCHNLEKYIGLAIESVLKQDYSGQVEILVVDDQSSDGSAEVIKSYSNVRYTKTDTNVGVLMATVIGIENTSGEYVFFLDGDDIWEPSKISKSLAAYANDPSCNLVTHDLRYIDSNGLSIERTSRPEVEMAGLSNKAAGVKTQRGILLHTDYVWLGSAFSVHRIKADLAGFCAFARVLPDTFNTYQDWPLAYWAAAQANATAAYVPEKLFRYRLHGANHSGDSTSLAKAVRNYKRTLNTMSAISMIAQRFNVHDAALRSTRSKTRFYAYLNVLYADRKWDAIKGYISNLSYITLGPVPFLKESLRFFGIMVLGPKGFIRASNAANSNKLGS